MTGSSTDAAPPSETRSIGTDESRSRNEASSTVLLDQFYVTLRVIQNGIGKSTDVADAPIHTRINELFRAPASGRVAYEIEQLQCLVLSIGQLDTELHRRLAEAEANQIPHVAAVKARLVPVGPNGIEPAVEIKRAELHRLVNDLQWFYTKRFQRRRSARVLNLRVSMIFLGGFATLLTFLLIQLASLEKQHVPRVQPPGTTAPAPQPASK